jgi:ABC-2 type transport system permease protein
MKQLRYLLKREFKLFLTNKTMLSVFYCTGFLRIADGIYIQSGKVTDIPVIVVNYDKTPLSYQIIDMLNDNKSIKVLNYEEEPTVIKDEVIKPKQVQL